MEREKRSTEEKNKVVGRVEGSAAVTIPQICLSFVSEQSDTREKTKHQAMSENNR